MHNSLLECAFPWNFGCILIPPHGMQVQGICLVSIGLVVALHGGVCVQCDLCDGLMKMKM